jgi:hypothetical protein
MSYCVNFTAATLQHMVNCGAKCHLHSDKSHLYSIQAQGGCCRRASQRGSSGSSLPEASLDRSDGVASVGVARDVLIHALHAHLDAGATVREHLCEVRGVAVVGPRLNGEANALGAARLAVCHLNRYLVSTPLKTSLNECMMDMHAAWTAAAHMFLA